jgi:hypothetical protein
MFPYDKPIRSPEEHYTYSIIDAATEGWRRYSDHRVPGLIINEYSDPNKRRTTLPIAPSDNDNIAMHPNVLIVRYLESYEHAGVYHVSLCGERIGTVASLTTVKKSASGLYVHYLNDKDFSRCVSMQQNLPKDL